MKLEKLEKNEWIKLHNILIKYKVYINFGITNSDPVTKEHAPAVMSQLVRQLQTQVSAYGSGALSSQIRLLLLAAQRLQKA